MNSSVHNMERFDAYLNSEMSETERMQFEKELDQNPELKSEFAFHKAFLDDLHDTGEYQEIRGTLRTIHKKPGVGDRNFFLSPQFFVPLSLVAGLALLITIINPFDGRGDAEVAESTNTYEKYEVSPAESIDDSSLDSTGEEVSSIEMDYTMNKISSDYFDPIAAEPSGTAFLISANGYFLTTKSIPLNETIVSLQSADKEKSFQAAVIYRDPYQDFAVLKCHKDIAREFDSVPFRFFDGDADTVKRVFTIGFDQGSLRYFKADFYSGMVNRKIYGDSAAYTMKLKTVETMAGSPVFTEDGQLIGMAVLIKHASTTVTFVLDTYYIGIKLDDLLKENSDLNMNRNYQYPAGTGPEFQKVYKPYIFELHP